jgi:hypothetical protein
MGKFRGVVASLAAVAMALAIPASPAQAEPSIQVGYSTSCGRVTVISTSSAKVAVYYGSSTLASSLDNADGISILEQYEFDTIATVKSPLYVTAIAYGSTPSSWTVKALTVPQDCKGIQSSISITGIRRVGKTLTAKLVKWVPKPLFSTYTWYRSGKEISGATDSTYKLTAADKGKHIKVKVHASFVGYKDATRTSKATAAIKTGVLVSSRPKVTITGWLATAWAGTWGPSPLTLSYQWYKGSKKIKGATDGLFTVPTSYVGKTIKVRVTGTRSGYAAVSRFSKSVTVTGSE